MVARSKRPSEVVGLTQDGIENTRRPSKVSRTNRMIAAPLANVINGQRLGESADFIPFSQRDDDENAVDDLVQSSQSVSESDISLFQTYGIWTPPNHQCWLLPGAVQSS